MGNNAAPQTQAQPSQPTSQIPIQQQQSQPIQLPTQPLQQSTLPLQQQVIPQVQNPILQNNQLQQQQPMNIQKATTLDELMRNTKDIKQQIIQQQYHQQQQIQQMSLQQVSEFNELEEVAHDEVPKGQHNGMGDGQLPKDKPKVVIGEQPPNLSLVKAKKDDNPVQKRRKMRDVSQSKKLAYYEATNRVINAKTAKQTDLMLCVKESQMSFAQLIISNFKPVDVVDLHGLDEQISVKKGEESTTSVNGKNWHPIAWALGTSKMDYLSLFYSNMQPHLQHALDINPLKTLYQTEESGRLNGKLADPDSLFLNKGKCQALCLSIQQRNWDTFKFTLEKSYLYLTGWHTFICVRTFIDAQWMEGGVFKFIDDNTFRSIIKAIPNKNRRDLLSNMTEYARSRVQLIEFDKITECFNILATQIETMVSPQFQQANEQKFKINSLVNTVFDAVIEDSLLNLEKVFNQNEALFQQIDICQILKGISYSGLNISQINSLTKLSYYSGKIVEVLKFDQLNPLTLAIICNSLKSLKYLVQKNINLIYALAKPGSYEQSDTIPIKFQLFALSYTISKDYKDMFKYLYGGHFSLWRYEHLKTIIEQAMLKEGDAEFADFVIKSPRTHVLFNYHTYFDKMLLTGYMIGIISQKPILMNLESTLLTTKLYQGPLIFHILSNPQTYHFSGRLKPLDFMAALTDNDISEYIEGVGSNQALYMISELIQFGESHIEPQILGLNELVERIEGHYLYF